MRIKIIKNYKKYKSGDIVNINKELALNLLDKGIATMTKDMTSGELHHG